jgi:hypothetical protein
MSEAGTAQVATQQANNFSLSGHGIHVDYSSTSINGHRDSPTTITFATSVLPGRRAATWTSINRIPSCATLASSASRRCLIEVRSWRCHTRRTPAGEIDRGARPVPMKMGSKSVCSPPSHPAPPAARNSFIFCNVRGGVRPLVSGIRLIRTRSTVSD